MYIGVDCGAQSLLTRDPEPTPNPTASLPMTRPMPVTVRPWPVITAEHQSLCLT